MHKYKSLNVSKTSIFVSAIPLIPDIIQDCLTNTASNQPHLLFLPVTVPNSFPFSAILSPISHNNSVGKGPLPTRVVYALAIPMV